MLKNTITKPARPPPVGTIFAVKSPIFFYTLSIHLNMLNKNHKTLENQGLELLSKLLSMR